MKILIAFIITSLLSVNSFANGRIWIAADIGTKAISSYDVQKFTMALNLSDGAMISLFKKSNGDYSKYQEEVLKWVAPRFEKHLQLITYAQILKKKALREDKNKNFFKITTSDFLKEIDKAEDKVLGKLLKEGKGIVKSRQAYGQFLIESQYPHRSGESAQDVYFRWYKLTKARIKIESLLEEVKKYETYMALDNPNDLVRGRVDGLAIWDYYDSAKKAVKEVNGKKLSVKEIQSFLKKNESVKVLTEDFKHYSLLNTSFKKLVTKRSDVESIAYSFSQKIKSKNNKKNIESYAKKAQTLKAKYKSNVTLESKKDNAVQQFVKTGEHKFMMMAHLYSVAMSDNKNSDSTESILDEASSVIEEALKNNESNDNLIQITEKSLLTVAQKDNALKHMIHFMIVFEAKKLSINDKGLVNFSLKEYNDTNTYNLIKNSVRTAIYKKGLKKFRRELKRENSWSLKINKNGSYRMSGDESVNFIFGK